MFWADKVDKNKLFTFRAFNYFLKIAHYVNVDTYYKVGFKLNLDMLTQEDTELDSQDADNAQSLAEVDLEAIDDQFDFYQSMEKI